MAELWHPEFGSGSPMLATGTMRKKAQKAAGEANRKGDRKTAARETARAADAKKLEQEYEHDRMTNPRRGRKVARNRGNEARDRMEARNPGSTAKARQKAASKATQAGKKDMAAKHTKAAEKAKRKRMLVNEYDAKRKNRAAKFLGDK